MAVCDICHFTHPNSRAFARFGNRKIPTTIKFAHYPSNNLECVIHNSELLELRWHCNYNMMKNIPFLVAKVLKMGCLICYNVNKIKVNCQSEVMIFA